MNMILTASDKYKRRIAAEEYILSHNAFGAAYRARLALKQDTLAIAAGWCDCMSLNDCVRFDCFQTLPNLSMLCSVIDVWSDCIKKTPYFKCWSARGEAQNTPDCLINRILKTEFLVFVGKDFSCAYMGNGMFPPSNHQLGDIDARVDELIDNGVIDRDMFDQCVDAGLLDDLKQWRRERRFTTSIAICDDIEKYSGYRTLNANVWINGASTAKRE